MIHQSILLSVILYGYPAWNASISSLRSLESFQKKVLQRILPSLDYVSALQSLDMLLICFQLIKIDLILLWKIQHNQIDIHHKLPFSQQQTRSQARFLFQPLKKFNSDANFYVNSTRAANKFLQRIIVSFDMPFTSYKYALHNFLKSSIPISILLCHLHSSKNITVTSVVE